MAADSFEATEQTMRTPGGALDDRLLEEEYLKAEKGKMNTLAVFIVSGVQVVVLPKSYERYCRYWIFICSLCIFKSMCFTLCTNVGWYYPWNLLIRSGLLYDGSCNLSTDRYSQQYGKSSNRILYFFSTQLQLGLKSIKTNNVYAEMVYNVLPLFSQFIM